VRRADGAAARAAAGGHIDEYIRHNGHADLLRELIDGATGY